MADIFDLAREINARRKQASQGYSSSWEQLPLKVAELLTDRTDASMRRAAYVLNKFDRIVRSVASQNKGIGREQVIKDIKNPSFSPEKTQTNNAGKSVIDQIQDQIFGE